MEVHSEINIQQSNIHIIYLTEYQSHIIQQSSLIMLSLILMKVQSHNFKQSHIIMVNLILIEVQSHIMQQSSTTMFNFYSRVV